MSFSSSEYGLSAGLEPGILTGSSICSEICRQEELQSFTSGISAGLNSDGTSSIIGCAHSKNGASKPANREHCTSSGNQTSFSVCLLNMDQAPPLLASGILAVPSFQAKVTTNFANLALDSLKESVTRVPGISQALSTTGTMKLTSSLKTTASKIAFLGQIDPNKLDLGLDFDQEFEMEEDIHDETEGREDNDDDEDEPYGVEEIELGDDFDEDVDVRLRTLGLGGHVQRQHVSSEQKIQYSEKGNH
ncbi:unnamed protein product [Protopolystoma xenopodis]|uniref:Uncharacterized protein n=1 Tax=Protopolystoma xenopodis TaxID=117903 RepID=A0A3S5FDE6_9PLAT|nr:unnamed protein product [Protopolystoma xenopodis]